MRVCDFIARHFQQIGISKVFGFQGGAITPLIDALALNGISYIQGYHEQAAGFMADCNARLTHQCAVAMATNGPGLTNLVTAVANAYLDSVPVLFLTGQVNTTDLKSSGIRQNGFQEVDNVAIVKPITKYAALVKNPEDVLYELEKAIYIATEGRKGAVLLDFPLNVLMAEIPLQRQHSFIPPSAKYAVSSSATDRVIEVLSQAKRPVALLGGGVQSANADTEIYDFLNKTHIPSVCTLMGRDVFSPTHIGFSGLYGNTAANLAVYNADVLLVFAARLSKRQFGKNLASYAPHAKIIHIDIDLNEKNHVVKPMIFIQQDIKIFLRDILAKTLPACPADWIKHIQAWQQKYEDTICVNSPLDPIALIRQISDLSTPDCILTTDVGQNQMWCAQAWHVKEKQRYISSGGLGCMGFSLPAAIGAQLTEPGKQVIAFMGDGGLQMNIQEFQTIQYYRLPVKIVVFNNQSLGMIQENQYKYMQARYVGTKEGYATPDLSKVAQAYHINYFTPSQIHRFMQESGPALLEIKLPQNPTRLLLKYDQTEIYEQETIF